MQLRWLFEVPILTVALGFSLAFAYFLVGGQLALRGPYALARSWPLIYPLMALFAAVVGATFGRLSGRRLTAGSIALLVLLGWIGEYFVLASRILADELDPVSSLGFWVMATGGPLQPAAAVLGAWLGRRTHTQGSGA